MTNGINGKWAGACHNTTCNVTAELTLILHQEGAALGGMLLLGGDELSGSGAIHGTVEGAYVVFTSPGTPGLFNDIVWCGTLNGNCIQGTYRVEPDAAGTAAGAFVQIGTFTVWKE